MNTHELRTTRKDIRNTAFYKEAQAFYTAICQPGTGQISDVAEVHAAADGKEAVFAGSIVDELHGSAPTRICRIDLDADGRDGR
jgi:hypothetical protein